MKKQKDCLGYLKNPKQMILILGYAPEAWECEDCNDKEECKGEKQK